MKATVKMYQNDGSKTNNYPIKLILTHCKKIKRITIATSSPADWDFIHELPKRTHIDFENLYGRILDIRARAVSSAFTSLTDLPRATDFFSDKEDLKTTDFYKFADIQIEEMKQLKRTGNAAAYQCAVDQLKKFSSKLEFSQLDRYFLEGFKRHKKIAGLKNTSIRTYLFEIRAIYNKAVRLGLTEDKQPFTGLFTDLRVRRRRHKNEYLSRESLAMLKNQKGLRDTQRQSIDLCLLQFYLCGADLVDVYYLKWSQITGNRVFLQRTKLGARGYDFDVLLLIE